MSQLRSISRLAILNIGNAIVGVLTSVAMAWLFGTRPAMQAYFAAATLLTVVQRIFLVGQFSEAFLPEYVQRRERDGSEKADRCFSALYNHLIMMVVVVAGALFFILPWMGPVIAPGFDDAQQRQVARLGQALLVVMCMVVANGHLQIIGNGRGWYGRFQFYGLMGSVAGLVLLVATGKVIGIWGLILSQAVTQIVLYIGSWSYLVRQGYRHAWIWNEPGFSVWKVSARVGVSSAYVFATQFYVVAFNASLTLLPGSLLAVYKYAENLYFRTGTLFMQPVGTVFFTDAAILSHRNPLQLRVRIGEALYQYGLMYCGVLAVLFPAMPSLLAALWGSSKYLAPEIHQTAFFAWCFYGLLIAEGAGGLFRRINVIMGDMQWNYVFMAVVQFSMAFIAPAIVRAWGVWGAAATLIFNVIGLAATGLLIVCIRRPQFITFFPLRTWKLAAAVVLPLLVAWVLPVYCPGLAYTGDYSLAGKIMEATKAAGLGGLGLVLALTVAWLLGVEELHSIRQQPWFLRMKKSLSK